MTNPDGKPYIDHIDTNPSNNRVENLHWVTQKENMNNPLSIQHNSDSQKGKCLSEETRKKLSDVRKGRILSEETKKKIGYALKGKFNTKFSKKVGQYSLDNNLIQVFPSLMEVERQLNYNSGNVSACCLGRYKQAYGFIWRYL